MNLKIVSEKTLRMASLSVIKSVEVSSDISRNNFIVVPDRFSLAAEKALFKKLNITSTFNIEVVSISRLAKMVLELAGASFTLEKTEKGIMKIYDILLKENFSSFSKENISYELAKQIYLTISQLKSSKILTSDFEKAINANANSKFSDILAIYKLYEENREEFDPADLLNLFEKEIENSQLIKNSNFYFAEFDSFTYQTYTILKLLIKTANCVTVGVQNLHGANKHIIDESIINWLSKTCEELKLTPEIISNNSELNQFQNHIADNLLSLSPQKINSDKIAIVAEKDPYSEVLEIANFIKLKIKRGYKFYDFNLIVPSFENYGDFIKQIFDRENIPYYLDTNVSFFSSAPVVFIFEILEYLLNPTELGYLTLLNNQFFEGDYASAKKSIYELGKDFLDFAKDNEKLNSIIQKSHNSSSVKDFALLVEEVIMEYQIYEKLEGLRAQMLESGDEFGEKIYSQFKDKFNSVLENLKTISHICSLKDFISLFKDICESTSIINIPLKIDSVFVGTASESFFEERKILLVLGANAGALPEVIKDLSLIHDHDIEMLNLDINPTVKLLNKRSKLKFFNLLTLGKEYVFLTLTNVDILSEFVKSLINIFDVKISYNFFVDKISDELWKKEIEYQSLSNIRLDEILSKVKAQKQITKEEFENPKKLFYSNNATSISKMQDFFRCPFLHFAKFGLKLEKNQTAEISPLDVGTLFHDFAELFVKNYSETVSEESVSQLFDLAIKNNERLSLLFSLKKHAGYFKYLKNLSMKFAETIIYQIKNSEYNIDKNLIEKPFKIKIYNDSGEDIFVSGRFDRVDKSSTGFRVIDYKTGNNKVNLKDIYYGTNLQLPIYLIAVMSFGEAEGAFYFPVFTSQNEDVRLSGLFENDPRIIKLLDKNLKSLDKKSRLIDITLISNDKEIKPRAKQGLLKKGNLIKVLNYSKELFRNGIKESLSGKIYALPFENNMCENCEYYALCTFKNYYKTRTQKAISESELVEIIKEEDEKY